MRLNEILTDPEGQWESYANIALVQQQLQDKTSSQQLRILESAANADNQRIAEWAVGKILDIDSPRAYGVLRKIGRNKTDAGRKAKRLLKIKGARK